VFHNILVSYDGSPDSRQALDQAIDLAQSEKARLTVLTAVRSVPFAALSSSGASAVGELEQELAQEAEANVHEAASQVPANLPVTTIVSYKPIGPTLIEQIDQADHDLLIMGSRGRGPIRSTLLGSTSHFALNHSPVPVLIVHERRTDRDAGADESSRDRPLVAQP
jgi:nucleotide-binding universal stress UspA family protein